MKRRFTIITGYHFNSSKSEEYARLHRCLWALAREVGKNGRIIVVANGTENGAQDPDQVIHGLGHLSSVKIEPIILRHNTAGNVQMWNAGVAMALAFPFREPGDEWIGCVTCSTVLQPDWLKKVESCLNKNENVNAAFGRLVTEDDPNLIWSDGHQINKRRTYDLHRLKAKSASKQQKEDGCDL